MGLNVGTLTANLELDSSKFEKGIDKSKQDSEAFAGKLNTVVKAGLLAVAAGFVAVGTAAYKSYETIDDAYDNIRSGTGAIGDDLTGLRTSFDNVFANVPGDAADVSDAIATLNTKFGATGVLLESLTTQMINLGRITGSDVSSNIDSLTDVYNNWGISVEDTAAKSDYLYKISQRTDVSVSDIANTMKTYGPLLRSLGYDFDNAAALVGNLGKSGFETSTIMSGLKMSMNNFDMDTPAAQIASLNDQIDTITSNMEIWHDIAVESGDMDKYAAQVEDAEKQIAELEYQIKVITKRTDGATESQKSFADAWKDTLVQLQNAETQTERVTIATALTSRAGIDLAGAFESGSFTTGLDELVTSATGSKDTINGVAKETADLKEALETLGQNATLALAPVGDAMASAVESITPELTTNLNRISEVLPTVITGFLDLNDAVNEGTSEGTIKFWDSINTALERLTGITTEVNPLMSALGGIIEYNTTKTDLFYTSLAAVINMLSALLTFDLEGFTTAGLGLGLDVTQRAATATIDMQTGAYGVYENVLGVDMPDFATETAFGQTLSTISNSYDPNQVEYTIRGSSGPGMTSGSKYAPTVNIYAQTNADPEEIARTTTREARRLWAGGYGI